MLVIYNSDNRIFVRSSYYPKSEVPIVSQPQWHTVVTWRWQFADMVWEKCYFSNSQDLWRWNQALNNLTLEIGLICAVVTCEI